MISVSGVSMRFGSKVLFEDVTTTFTPGRRYGLTGPNGAGKSTFMKLLTGEQPPQRGSVVRPPKLGVLRQGFLELSNVEPVRELIDLITTQRSFEMNSQVIEAGNNILQTITNLARR